MDTPSGKLHTAVGPTAHLNREREHTTPTSTVESTALKCEKITEFQGLTCSPDWVLFLLLSDRETHEA